MKKTDSIDSIECRNCHDFSAMSHEKQRATPCKKHMEAKEQGKSCIDCHKGIAHRLPNAASPTSGHPRSMKRGRSWSARKAFHAKGDKDPHAEEEEEW